MKKTSISFKKFLLGGAIALFCLGGETLYAESKSSQTGEQLYLRDCASCHNSNRLGADGPALLPQNLSRLRKNKAFEVIRKGAVATQMPAFPKLTDEEIQKLIKYIYTPLPYVPTWGVKEISASRVVYATPDQLSDQPVFQADPYNLFFVVEKGDHHATVLDGDKFEPITRFKTRFALHGGIKYSPDGRYAYMASRDGWVSKYDVYNLKMVAEVRAGINTRNIAVSKDARYVMVGNYLPHSVVILDANTLKPIKYIEALSKDGETSRVSAVYTAPPRESFIVALKDVPEVWEIPYHDQAKAPYKGLVHDYRPDSGEPIPEEIEKFPIRRIQLHNILDDFFFDQNYDNILGSSRKGESWVVNLIVGRPTMTVDLPGMPHLGAGITWTYQGRKVFATPNLKEGTVSVIDAETWKVIKKIKTDGPGFFLRSHKNSNYAWVDVFFGPNKDIMHVIDKRTLEVVKTLKPVAKKVSGHIEFTRDGRYALLSIWDQDGELIVYDAKTFEIVKRLPMKKPSGKYNVYNKISYAKGTSH